MTRAFFTSEDGLKLAYSDDGPKDGLAILCLSGLTRDMRDFDYVAPHLSTHRLIRMDYRGRGASDWAANPQSYAISQEANDAIGLLNHLGVKQAAIIGSSRGGLVAMALASSHKSRLLGVCLNDIGPMLEAQGLAVIADYIGRRPKFLTQDEFAAAKPEMMVGFDNVPMQRWQSEVAHQTQQTDTGLELTYDPKLRDIVLASLAAPAVDLWPLFDCLADLPLALIRGANSNLLSQQTAKDMGLRRPDMLFANVLDRGHIPFLDEPASLGLIHDWIAQCR